MSKIGIVIIATNTYFPLGIRLIKQIEHYYKTNKEIEFYFFSDTEPFEYINEKTKIKFYEEYHKNWVEGVGSKFKNIIKTIEENFSDFKNDDYILFLDADTSINRIFYDSDFLEDIIACEHFGNETYMKDDKHFERNSNFQCHIPKNTKNEEIYVYGFVMGGVVPKFYEAMKKIKKMQDIDRSKNLEPRWNDESYWNHYIHYNKPKLLHKELDFFNVSHKGGGLSTRSITKNREYYKTLEQLKKYKNKLIEIENKEVKILKENENE